MARHASARKKPIWSDVIELQAKAIRDRFQDRVLQLSSHRLEGFVSKRAFFSAALRVVFKLAKQGPAS